MDHKDCLARAIALTDEILELLDSGDFERIDELDAARQPLIKQAFTESIEQIDLIKARHLQNLNQQVVDRLSLFKDAIITRQKQLKNAKNGAQVYRNTCSDPNF